MLASKDYTLYLRVAFLNHRIDSDIGNNTDWSINSDCQTKAKPSWSDRTRSGSRSGGEEDREDRKQKGEQLATITHKDIRLVDAGQNRSHTPLFVIDCIFVCVFCLLFGCIFIVIVYVCV